MIEANKHFISFSKPLVAAVKGIYSSMFSSNITVKTPKLKKDHNKNLEISAYITFEGSLSEKKNTKIKAIIALSWSKKSYINIANAMLMEEFQDINAEMMDVGPEVLNMITGNAKKDFKEAGLVLTLSAPVILSEDDKTIPFPDKSYIISIDAISDKGNFVIDFSYLEVSS